MSKRLFVGGLPFSLSQDEVKAIFDKVGAVISCDLIMDKFTQRSKGFAFVEMEDADADNAIKALDGTEVGGRKIVVNIARPREERSSGNFDNRRSGGFYRGGNRGFRKGGFRRDSRRD